MEYKLLLLLIGTAVIAAQELRADQGSIKKDPDVNCWIDSVNGYLPRQRCLLRVTVNKSDCSASIVEYHGTPFAIKKLEQKYLPNRVNPTKDFNLFDIQCYGNECTLDRDLIKKIWETEGPFKYENGECFDKIRDIIVDGVQKEAVRAAKLSGLYPSSTTPMPSEPTTSGEEATTNPGYIPVKDSTSVPSVMQPIDSSTTPYPIGEPRTTNPGPSATPRSTTRRQPRTTRPLPSATPRSTTRRQPRTTRPLPSATLPGTTSGEPRTTRPLLSATPSGSPSGEPSNTEPLPSVTPSGSPSGEPSSIEPLPSETPSPYPSEEPSSTEPLPSATPSTDTSEEPRSTEPLPSVTPSGSPSGEPSSTEPLPSDTPTDTSEEPISTNPDPSETPQFPQPTTPPPPSRDCKECVKLFSAILQKLEIVPLCASHDTDCLKRSLEKVNRLIEEKVLSVAGTPKAKYLGAEDSFFGALKPWMKAQIAIVDGQIACSAEYLITGGNPCDIERYRIIQKELEAWKLSLQRQVDPQLLKLKEYKEKLEQIERILSDSSAADEFLIIQARGEIQEALRIIRGEAMPTRATPRFIYEDILYQKE